MKKRYKIGNFLFQVEFPDNLEIQNHFQLFETDELPLYFYTVYYVDILPVIKGNIVFRDHILVLDINQKEARYIATKGEKDPYALLVEEDSKHTNVYLLKEQISNLQYDPFYASLFALEKRMIIYNEMILHCAYMIVDDQAILFSGPSGMGKSTQAGLWQKYRKANIINGDKALLHKKDNTWYANGWPVCGSSKICHNESYPIKCIVMLSKAKENRIERLSSLQAFKLLYQQITNNIWNSSFHLQVMDLIEKLIFDIPIYHLACDISEEAVLTLEKQIKNE